MSNKDTRLFQSLKETLICPITRRLLLDPVFAPDGIVYERQAITKWLKTHNISPSTGKEMSKEIFPAYSIKTVIYCFLEHYPKLKEEQYVLEKNNHMDFSSEINIIMRNGQYQSLLGYQNFYLDKLDNFKEFIEKAPWDIIQYVVENTIKSDETASNYDRMLMILACRTNNLNLIKYLVDKNTSFNINVDEGLKKPIHYLCKYCGHEAIKTVLSKFGVSENEPTQGQYPIHLLLRNSRLKCDEKMELLSTYFTDLNKETKDGIRPINLACDPFLQADNPKNLILYLLKSKVVLNSKYTNMFDESSKHLIHQILGNNILSVNDRIELLDFFEDLEQEDSNGNRIIHHACIMESADAEILVRYLADRNVNFGCANAKGERPIHLLCDPKTAMKKKNLIEYLVEQKKVDLECTTQKGDKPIHLLLQNRTNLPLIKFLLDHGAMT